MDVKQEVYVNFFKPSTDELRTEVGVAKTILVLWALVSYGVPLVIWLAGLSDPSGLGESFITRARFLGFPLHYWLLAQGCTMGFVALCKFYCVLWDKKVTRR
ncbi:MAG: DUF4212 domain-containing protein [Desulfuromonadales bacterium]|nr:DUF4212 domain-containing protein [Desulfuromonadales bacterium]NIS39214.1 DUF4212 domain-containing protein [Desulfuromonadales bacterium]